MRNSIHELWKLYERQLHVSTIVTCALQQMQKIWTHKVYIYIIYIALMPVDTCLPILKQHYYLEALSDHQILLFSH